MQAGRSKKKRGSKEGRKQGRKKSKEKDRKAGRTGRQEGRQEGRKKGRKEGLFIDFHGFPRFPSVFITLSIICVIYHDFCKQNWFSSFARVASHFRNFPDFA